MYFLYIIMKTMAFTMYLAPFLIVYLAVDSPMFRILATPIAIALILAGPLRAYSSRVVFCMRLKSTCRRAKLKCKCKHILAPFFMKTDGFDILITDRRSELYSIKFFKGNVDKKGIHLRDMGKVELIRYLVFPRLGGRFSRGKVERTEHSRKIIRYEMPVAKYGETIMLFSPSPYQMTALRGNKLLPIGNGEEYEGFHIYTARGFTDFIKRKLL